MLSLDEEILAGLREVRFPHERESIIHDAATVAFARKDFTVAMAITRRMRSPSDFIRVLRVRILGESGRYDAAIRESQRIGDPTLGSRALVSVARRLASRRRKARAELLLKKALSLATSAGRRDRGDARSDVLAASAELGLVQVHHGSLTRLRGSYRDSASLSIAAGRAVGGDIEGALLSARTIESATTRSSALAFVARRAAEAGLALEAGLVVPTVPCGGGSPSQTLARRRGAAQRTNQQ